MRPWSCPPWSMLLQLGPLHGKKIKEVEAVQRRVACLVVGDYRYTSSLSQMNEDLGWQSLQNRCSYAKLRLCRHNSCFLLASYLNSTHEVIVCVIWCHTAVQTATATPSIHQVFACGIKCQKTSSQLSPWQPLRKVYRGRLSTE